MDLDDCNLLAFYGTLRGPHKHQSNLTYLSTTCISGAIYNLGAFPALVLTSYSPVPSEHSTVVVEVYESHDDSLLASFDRYEGYCPDDEEGSLYLRRKTKLLDGTDREAWVYVFNRSVSDYPIIESGDWFNR